MCAQQLDTRIRAEAQLGTAVCRTLSRPRMPSLQSPPSLQPSQRPANEKHAVEETLILNEEQDDLHELAADPVRLDDENEPSVALQDSALQHSTVTTANRTRASPNTKVVRIDSESSDDEEDIEELSPEQLMAPPAPKAPLPTTQAVNRATNQTTVPASKKPFKIANSDDVQKNVDEMLRDFVVD